MLHYRHKSDKIRFKHIQKHIKGENILDIGSREGYLHKMIVSANKNKKIFSLDNSKDSDFSMDLDKPKKINEKFDTIIAGEIIEHLESPINFIRYCKSLLNKNGKLVITTPNSIGLQYIANESWCVNYKDYRGHTQAFTMSMLDRILKDEGLKIVDKKYINAFWNRNPLQVVSLLVKRLRPDLMIVATN